MWHARPRRRVGVSFGTPPAGHVHRRTHRTAFTFRTPLVCRYARASEGGFTRLMIEKPFGRDSATFEELDARTRGLFREAQLFRLDHVRASPRLSSADLA